MLVSSYLSRSGYPLWACLTLVVILVPVTLWHEHNWHRTLETYGQLRIEAGAAESESWPPEDYAWLMGVQLWLVLLTSALLASVTGLALWLALQWPEGVSSLDLPINRFDLPYLWGFAVAGGAATVAGLAIAWDMWRSPWVRVARRIRWAIYAKEPKRARLFTEALALDPGIPRPVEDQAPEPPCPDADNDEQASFEESGS